MLSPLRPVGASSRFKRFSTRFSSARAVLPTIAPFSTEFAIARVSAQRP